MLYFRITGRIRLNTHSLNAYGGAGSNYIEITKVKTVVKKENGWDIVEVPAISGNMVKHWHFVSFVDSFRKTKYGENLTERALRYNATRFSQNDISGIMKANGNKVEKEKLDNEETIIIEFADADVHGFLLPVKGGKSIRRVSLVKTSFIVPTEDFINNIGYERTVYPIKHNRVDVDEKGAIKGSEEEGAMMIWDREYASGLYGFEIIMDLGLVGKPQSNPKQLVISEEEAKERAKSSIEASVMLLSGYLGANLSRSYPIQKLEEAILVASKEPIPSLVHGYYMDYLYLNKNMLETLSKKKSLWIATIGIQEKLTDETVSLKSITELTSYLEELFQLQ